MKTVTQASPRPSDAPPPVDPTWVYRGERIVPSFAADNSLACMDDETLVTRCFATEAQLEVAEVQRGLTPGPNGDGVIAAAARRALRRAHRRAHAANHESYYPLQLWRDNPAGGWRVDTYSSCQWFDLTGSYDNATSLAYTGSHSAQLGATQGYPYSRAVLGSTYTYYAMADYGIDNWRAPELAVVSAAAFRRRCRTPAVGDCAGRGREQLSRS